MRALRAPATRFALALGALGAFGTVLECLADVRRGFTVYLAAFGFLASTALGGLIVQMTMHACAARWFVVLRRLCEAIAGSALLVPIFFAPIAFGLRFLYPWARSDALLDTVTRESLAHARSWLSPRPFFWHTLFYFFVWLGFTEFLRRASLAEDRGRVGRANRALQGVSAVGLPVMAFVGSFAVFDWLMSSVPGWTSSIVGLRVLVGGFGSALGVLAIALQLARRSQLLPAQVGAAHAHALGRLLLTATCLWAYLAASELIIVWSANLPREVPFFLARWQGAARVLSFVLIVGHFALPFVLLLVRSLKRRAAQLAWLGAWLCLMHAVDMYWLVVPTVSASVNVLDLAPFLLVGAAGAWLMRARFARAPALPLSAPDLAHSLSYESP
ncbi:MAG TPA: hypothetical protein VGM29_13690 [Polyangiaceae bacterium]|jgi:hypothetical protein